MAYRRKGIAAALAYALGIGSTAAWIDASAQEQQNQRILVTVTGSNIIPRIEGETALPVQVITREDIERANIQTAAELLKTVSANMSFGSFTEVQSPVGSSQPGLAGASLRGLTYQRTLILFNGRRIANYALTGNAIDLNVIPVAAIDRVEILKDGASAIYGSDAVGGVINFILRNSYQGAEASAQYTSPEHTGGYGEHYNVTAGYGDLASQKFNAFAMVDYQQFGGIIANDRPFARTSYVPGQFDQTSGRSFPGNVDTPKGTRNPTGDPNNSYQNPSCAPPLSFPTTASPTQCRYDYVRGIDIVAPSERLNLLGTFTWQIDPDNQFFLNGNYARNRFNIAGPPTGISNATTFQGINHFFLPPTSAFYPHAFAQFFGIDGRPLNIQWRSVELGPRTDAPIVEQSNVVAGMRGVVKGWNYDGAFTYSESNITDRYVEGYVRESVIIPILNSGVVNPFGFNTPDVVALMSTAKLDQTVRTGKGSLSSVDFHASNEILQLPAGPLALALGAEARQWKLTENVRCRHGLRQHRQCQPHPVDDREPQCVGRVCRSERADRQDTRRQPRGTLRPLQRRRLDDEPQVVDSLAAEQDFPVARFGRHRFPGAGPGGPVRAARVGDDINSERPDPLSSHQLVPGLQPEFSVAAGWQPATEVGEVGAMGCGRRVGAGTGHRARRGLLRRAGQKISSSV